MKRTALISLFVFTSLAGCGDPHPNVYLVAIDESSLTSVPATCYFTGEVPGDVDQRSNAFSEQQWTIWNGESSDSNYLNLPAMTWKLGDLTLNLPDATLVGGPKEWTNVMSDVQGTSNTREQTLTITFEGEPGGTGKGTVFAKVTNTCTGNSSCRSCEVSLPFFARRLPNDAVSTTHP